MIRLTLPIKTVNTLNGAQGTTRKAMFGAASRRKKQRAVTGMAVRCAWNGSGLSLPVVITITRVAPSNGLDCDALPSSQKSVRDGITDALGLTNDRDARLTWRYDQRRGARGYFGVEITIEQREAA